MKKVIILALIICSYALQAQEELKLKFIIENSSQVSSTVVIGRDYSATVGIDESFNEENIYGTELNEVDLRSIQRSEGFHECLNSSIWDNSGNPLYFENNMDLKIDMRNMDFEDSYNSCFEIKMTANNYPLNLIVDASGWDSGSLHFFWIGLYDNNCEQVKQVDLFNGDVTNLEIEEAEAIDRIIVKLNHEVSVKENKMSFFEIIPNPISSEGIIKFKNKVQGNIEIYSTNGVKVFEAKSRNEIRMSSSQLISGMYIVKYSDEKGKVDFKKLIIQ